MLVLYRPKMANKRRILGKQSGLFAEEEAAGCSGWEGEGGVPFEFGGCLLDGLEFAGGGHDGEPSVGGEELDGGGDG